MVLGPLLLQILIQFATDRCPGHGFAQEAFKSYALLLFRSHDWTFQLIKGRKRVEAQAILFALITL